ncbi:methyltransferase domain-containing protein [Thiotrichales bacterium 19X7-9]|nr:methyltransferase domain-containing protein [Thiotrichales bacterium 19X7-9]
MKLTRNLHMSHIKPEKYAHSNKTQKDHAYPIFSRINKDQQYLKILDIGCGDGHITDEIYQLIPNCDVTGIDISEEMINYASSTYPHIEFICNNAEINFKVGEFNLITSFSTAHWIENQYVLFNNILLNLKPNGRFLGFLYPICNIQIESLKEVTSLNKYKIYFNKFYLPYFDHTVEKYEQIFKNLKFKINLLKKTPIEFVSYPSKDDFIRFLSSWLPHINDVPNDMRDEFMCDFVDIYLKNVNKSHYHHCIQQDKPLKIPFSRIEIDLIREYESFNY